MTTKQLVYSQYLVLLSSDMNYNDIYQHIMKVITSLSGENEPENTSKEIFHEFFREVLHEESDYTLYRNDAFYDQSIFDFNNNEESGYSYVFGFAFDGDKIENERIVQVFNEVVIPVLKQYIPDIVVGDKILTHMEYKETLEDSIPLSTEKVVNIYNQLKEVTTFSKDDFVAYIKNKNIPLEERWGAFLLAPEEMKEYDRTGPNFESLPHDFILADGAYSMQRYQSTSTLRFIKHIEEVVKAPEKEYLYNENEIKEYLAIDIVALKEEILRKNMGAFEFNW